MIHKIYTKTFERKYSQGVTLQYRPETREIKCHNDILGVWLKVNLIS